MTQELQNKLVLYHAHCMDGFGAALVAWQVFVDAAEYRAVSYGEPVPEIPEHIEEIYVLDFSYPAAVLEQWAERRKVTVLDHHKTAQAELAKIGPRANLEIKFDLQKSGAVLTWEWFRDADEIDGNPVCGPVPELLLCVQDRDLWRWEMPSSREISAALAVHPRTFSEWDSLLWGANGVPKLRNEGRPILAAQAAMVEQICAKAQLSPIGEHLVPCVNTPILQSECCHRLLEIYPEQVMSATYFDKPSHDGGTLRIWSLRSRPGFDCSEMAKRFGGGGHPQASGFELRLPRPSGQDLNEQTEYIAFWSAVCGALGIDPRQPSNALEVCQRIDRLREENEWQPIETAPKSTGDAATGYVRGIYLLGFVPDPEACDPASCSSVIWWEPLTRSRFTGEIGCWYGQGALEVQPTYWRRLPATLPT